MWVCRANTLEEGAGRKEGRGAGFGGLGPVRPAWAFKASLAELEPLRGQGSGLKGPFHFEFNGLEAESVCIEGQVTLFFVFLSSLDS